MSTERRPGIRLTDTVCPPSLARYPDANTPSAVGPIDRTHAGRDYEQTVENGFDLTVVTGGVPSRLLHSHRGRLQDALDTGHVDVDRTDDTLPYGLVVTRTETGGAVFPTVYGDDGTVGAEAVACVGR